jgi:hypothetical protein
MELTITQNGGLYALQHRRVRGYRSNRKKRAGTAAIRVLTIVMRCIEQFRRRLILAGKVRASPLAAVGHFPDAFPYNWWNERLVLPAKDGIVRAKELCDTESL